MRVVAIAIDNLELMRSDRQRTYNTLGQQLHVCQKSCFCDWVLDLVR
ncbi:hypothetical protein [Nostoc sp.]